jgi:putative methyltransferase (TIGR04325 family)
VKRSELPQHVKAVIKELVPPGLVRLTRPFRKPVRSQYGYSGDYPTFSAALADCKTAGYSAANIIEKVSAQTRELKERWNGGPRVQLLDGRILQNLAAALLALSGVTRRPLSVLDFGGGLGIHYFQTRPFLGGALSWLVCETAEMAAEGTRRFASDELKFISSLDQARGPFDLLISSGAIQCVPNPAETLARHSALSDHVLFNRLPLIASDRDRLTIHKVDPAIYAASIPIWFFSQQRWLAAVETLGFDVTMRWEVPQDLLILDGEPIVLQGLLAQRRAR